MGQAHANVCNQSQRPICVITFNMADLIYKSYHTLYIIQPGETQLVEANPDAIGLKLGIVYETKREKQELLFHRFTCNNDSVLTIVSMEGQDIDHYGEGTTLNSKHKLRENDVEPFNMAADTLQSENATKKAPTKAQEFMHKVVDTTEVIAHKVVNTIEHPTEFIKSHRIGGSTATTAESDTSSIMNDSVNGRNQNDSDKSHNQQNTIAAKFANFTNAIINKDNKAPTPKAAPPPPPVVEEDPEVLAAKFEAELRRVKNEKKWEAELARIKHDKQVAEEEAYRREIEEREAEEAAEYERQKDAANKKDTPGKRKKKGGPDDGPEVVGAGGCACIVS